MSDHHNISAGDAPTADPFASVRYTKEQAADLYYGTPPEHRDAVEAALVADGIDLAALANPAASDHPWINPNAQTHPEQYTRGLDLTRLAQSLGSDPNTASTSLDRVANVQRELCAVAAELRMPTELGKPFIEHMAEGSITFKAHTAEQREQWLSDQKRSAMKVGRFADDAAYDKAVAEARDFLSAGNSELGKAIAQSDRIHDAWVLLTLLNHKRALARSRDRAR